MAANVKPFYCKVFVKYKVRSQHFVHEITATLRCKNLTAFLWRFAKGESSSEKHESTVWLRVCRLVATSFNASSTTSSFSFSAAFCLPEGRRRLPFESAVEGESRAGGFSFSLQHRYRLPPFSCTSETTIRNVNTNTCWIGWCTYIRHDCPAYWPFPANLTR